MNIRDILLLFFLVYGIFAFVQDMRDKWKARKRNA